MKISIAAKKGFAKFHLTFIIKLKAKRNAWKIPKYNQSTYQKSTVNACKLLK